MKIAKIMVGNPGNRKGFFNNVLERTKNLINKNSEVDCFIIRIEHSNFLKFLKKEKIKHKLSDDILIEQIRFKNLWVKMGLMNYILAYRLNRNIVVDEKSLSEYVHLFKDYDLISAHGIEAIFLAHLVKKKLGIPYVVTWHGSDINVIPFQSRHKYLSIKKLLSDADHNFFVSNNLLNKSRIICENSIGSVLYTGPASYFHKYSDDKIQNIKKEYRVETKYIIGFIGNFIPIKNVLVLPEIFQLLQEKFKLDVSFFLVGDGILNQELEELLDEYNIKNIHFTGKMNPEEIPKIMNILDVLILPSLNEGLPMVLLEAQACGVHAVGSDRGGIPEAIGIENSFALDQQFTINIANRIAQILTGNYNKPQLSQNFSWATAIETELMVYENVVSK